MMIDDGTHSKGRNGNGDVFEEAQAKMFMALFFMLYRTVVAIASKRWRRSDGDGMGIFFEFLKNAHWWWKHYLQANFRNGNKNVLPFFNLAGNFP